jgi:diguanylate cyclase (GGDEF)-like protein
VRAMISAVSVIAELAVLIFNILIFVKLTVLKKDCFVTKLALYGGSGLSLVAFATAVYTQLLPETLASFVFVTLPTFILFFILSKYKDFRFFVTFCFLDTVTLILTFFARAVNIWFGDVAGMIGYVILCVLMAVIYITGRPWFSAYRELLKNVRRGWATMAVSTLLVYLLLIFFSSYPMPMIQRPEYLVVYAFMSVTILSFYVVFVCSLLQKKELADLNEKLTNEKKWHKIAYIDSITGLKNRMAYIEHSNIIERESDTSKETYAVMMDIDKFKKINDTFGHHTGDVVLKKSADFLQTVFGDSRFELFRIGGDEFAVIARDVSRDVLEEKIKQIHCPNEDLRCSISCGYAPVDFEKMNAIENAFIEADLQMYKNKEAKKHSL